jgi:phospholipid/cholesterol/gamma-HCH transport system substrate-binding protein
MENRSYALSAGLFLLLLCAALIAVAVKLSGNTADRVSYVVESKLPVFGLNQNAPVRLRGVDVGKVKKVYFSPDDPNLILIDIAVDKRAPLTKGTYAKLSYLGITGLSFVQLDNDATAPEKLVSGNDSPSHIELRPSFFDQVSGSGEELLLNASEAAKRLNTLLSDQNLGELAATMSNLKTASDRMAALTSDLQPAAKAVSALALRSNRTIQKIDPLLDNLTGLTEDIRGRTVALDHMAQSAEEIGKTSRALGDTVPELHVLLNNFSRSLRMVDRVLSGIEQQPQSILFGRSPVPPGPGEDGFKTPARAR